jgi:hypothetical protein
MSQPGPPSLIDELSKRCGAPWPTMVKAQAAASTERARLAKLLTDPGLVPADTSVVVFGSLARGEWTMGSDLDWTLLVDGQVVSAHAEVAREIAKVFAGNRPPGPTGVFGGLTFSHDIVHFIGGNDDSNRNTTRRILLLLESASLDGDAVRDRVLRALLARYVGEDLLFHEPHRFRVPRFLLNDYVRYWRTMAVDSAQKRRDRTDKWALRNVKLRMSRKLIFLAGLWACLSCDLFPSAALEVSRDGKDREGTGSDMTTLLLQFSQRSPLETVAEAFLKYQAWAAAQETFDAYEAFLGILDDPDRRRHLEELKLDDAMTDETFRQAKAAASAFQVGLNKLFFKTDDKLTMATQTYGVF